jgi:hypothetical protein
MDTTLRDYASAMLLFARHVAEAEGRDVERVLVDLAAVERDRHRPARVEPSGARGASLVAAAAMLDGMTRALLASACSVLNPRPFHPRMALSDAESFIAGSRFIDTEVGSFVMVVETPMEVEGARPQFGRETSALLMRSVAHLTRSVRNGTLDRVVSPTPGDPVISANLCDAILQMAPPSEVADLRFAVSWSPLIPAPDAPASAVIDRHMYEAIEGVASALRPTEASEKATYAAWVKELKGAPGPTGKAEGEVVFLLVRDDGTTTRARAQLNPQRYEEALVAHGTPHAVAVEGELPRVRRGYELRNVGAISSLRSTANG